MKLPHQKKSIKPLLIAATVIALAITGGLFWMLKPTDTSMTPTAQPTPTNTVNYNPPTADDQAVQEKQKQETLKNDEPQPEPPQINLTVTISRADQAANGQPLNIRTFISGTSAGQCEITLTRGDKTVSRVFAVTPDPSSATCNGDIDVGAFSEAGEWQITITAKDGNKTSTATTQKVIINL